MQKFGWLSCLVALLPFFGVAETYTLAGTDDQNASAMNGSGTVGWTDTSGVTTQKHKPSAGNDYVVDQPYILRTPTTQTFTFGGDTLTVSGGSQIKVKVANNNTLTIPRLIVVGTNTMAVGDGNALNKIAGTVDIREDGVLKFDVSDNNASGDSRKFEVQSAVSGNGTLWTGASMDVKTAGPYVKFTGSLADFTGKVAVQGRGTAQFATVFASSLPGDPDEVLEDGLTVAGNAALKFETSGKLGVTRGVSLASGACEIYVAEGETVQIDGLLTGAAGFTKTGKGALALANVSSELSGTVTVAEGVLQLCDASSRALPNATVSVASGALLDEHGPVCGSDLRVVATLANVRVVEDGQPHGPVLTVTEPKAGCQVTWSVDGGDYTTDYPAFISPCEHTIDCRVFADGYLMQSLRATVVIGICRRIVATEAEKVGDWENAVVAGDDAWAAIQGVIDSCDVGDLILVKAGSYLLTNELAFASAELRGVTLRSDDGEGNLARKTTRFVGGYPATTNRLIRCSAQSVVVEGFTFTNGYVDATCGGAIWLDKVDAETRILNCDFLGNTAWWAAQEKASGSPGDKKTEGAGGAVFIEGAGVISNCIFRGNRGFSGAGVQTKSALTVVSPVTSVPYVTQCAFFDNSTYGPGNNSARYGSGAGLCAFGAAAVDHSLFVSNYLSSTRGTGIACSGNEGLSVSNCTFGGGHVKTALHTYGVDAILVATKAWGCTMANERDIGRLIFGSILDGHTYSNCTYSASGDAYTMRNCLFINNTVDWGIVYTSAGKVSYIDNCTFIGNTACFRSSGSTGNTNVVNNCVFLNNGTIHTASNDNNAKGCCFFMTNCVYAGKFTDKPNSLPTPVTAGCRTDLTPGTAKFFAVGRGDLHLREDSPLVGAGVTLDWMDGALDRDSNPRVVGGAPDIGCYERQEGTIDPPYPCTRAVAKEEDKTGEWANAVVGLQAAVDATYDYESIYAKAGTYGMADTVGVSCEGIRLVGVGPGAVVLDGGATGTNRLLTVTGANFQLENVTLQNGSMTDQGGALYLGGANAVVSNCVIRDCLSHYEGGAVYAASGAMGLRFFDTTIVDCASTNRGGAVFLAAADATFTRCTFDSCATVQKLQDDEKGTTDRAHGGGIYVKATGLVLDTCVFTNCIAGKELRYDGGALYVEKDKGLLATSCTFVACRSLRGGACFLCGGTVLPRYVDCTFSDNVNERIPSTLWDYERGRATDGSACFEQCVFCAHSAGSRSLLESFGATGVATNCYFEGLTNCAVADNGAISGSIFRWNTGITVKAELDRCVFVSNRTDNLTGGAVNFLQGKEMRNSLWAYNDGPISLNGAAYVENCTVVSNAGGFRIGNGATPSIRNCVVWDTTYHFWDGNYSGDATFCSYSSWTTNNLVLSNCVFQGGHAVNVKKYGKDPIDILSCDPSGASTQLTDLALRRGPKFVDPANGDWHLKSNSPLRDKGLVLGWMTDEAEDMDGKPRRISSDGKAYPDSLPDIGCYECDIPKPGLLLMVW